MPKFLDEPQWYSEDGKLRGPAYIHVLTIGGSVAGARSGSITVIFPSSSPEPIDTYSALYSAVKDLYEVSSTYAGPWAAGQLLSATQVASFDVIGVGNMRSSGMSLRGFYETGDFANGLTFNITNLQDTVI